DQLEHGKPAEAEHRLREPPGEHQADDGDPQGRQDGEAKASAPTGEPGEHPGGGEGSYEEREEDAASGVAESSEAHRPTAQEKPDGDGVRQGERRVPAGRERRGADDRRRV